MGAVIVPVVFVVIIITTVIHDLVVHDWEISNVRVSPVLSDIPVPPHPLNVPVKIKQEIDVSFTAKDSRWLLKFGKLPPAAFLMKLGLDSSVPPINHCDPSSTLSCPARTGGIDHTGSYSEHFTILWDVKGVHTLNIDVSVDGVRLGQLTAGVNIH